MDLETRMLMETVRKQRLVPNHLSTLQLRQELHCHRLLSNPQLFPRHSQLPSSQLVCHPHIQLLLLVYLLQLLWQVLKTRANKDLKEMHNSANMADIHRLVHKTSLHCPKSRMMPSVNKLLPPKAHSKAIQTNNPSPRVSPNLALSPLHPINSPLTTLPTRNNAMLITTIINSNMGCSKALRLNQKVLRLSNDHTAVTMGLKQRTAPNFRKALLSKPSHDMQLQERLKPVATRPQTQLLNPNNQELLKVLHPNKPVTSNNPKSGTTHMAIPTTPARIMLRT
jgi:hypothetical protein